ncbi:unnamed protein product, partial [Brenthis ino]
MSTDGASVMVKVGKLMNCYQQLCFAHGLQLAVIDVLYKKNEEKAEQHLATTPTTSNISDTDDEDTTKDDEQGVTVTITDPRHAYLCNESVTNPKKYLENVNRSDDTFTMPKKKVIRSETTKILERVIQEDTSEENIEEIVEENLDSPSLKKDLTLQEELQLQIQQEATCYSVHTKKEKDFYKVLKKEMTFESDGVRGEYLSAIHDYLLTIKPTSVETERAFSAAGYICSSIRSPTKVLIDVPTTSYGEQGDNVQKPSLDICELQTVNLTRENSTENEMLSSSGADYIDIINHQLIRTPTSVSNLSLILDNVDFVASPDGYIIHANKSKSNTPTLFDCTIQEDNTILNSDDKNLDETLVPIENNKGSVHSIIDVKNVNIDINKTLTPQNRSNLSPNEMVIIINSDKSPRQQGIVENEDSVTLQVLGTSESESLTTISASGSLPSSSIEPTDDDDNSLSITNDLARKRRRNEKERIANKSKTLKNSGKAYVGCHSKKQFLSKSVGPSCKCKLKCGETFSYNKRNAILETFYKLGQNKNRFVFALYLFAANKFKLEIVHRFFESGHSQNEGDSMHACVERAMKNKQIYTPDQLYGIVMNAKQTGEKYKVKEMRQDNFYDIKSLITGQNWLNNAKATSSIADDVTLEPAYNGPVPVSKALHEDLSSLCRINAIPLHYHSFYNSLISTNNTEAALDFPQISAITWNYTAHGHGKGAADGVAAVIKRTAYFEVNHGKDITTIDKGECPILYGDP